MDSIRVSTLQSPPPKLKGHLAIGHNRYSTAGQSHISNAQPFLVDHSRGIIALGHNGNLVTGGRLRRDLEESGSIFRSTSDSEVILHLIARSAEEGAELAIVDALNRLEGAFTLTMLTRDKLIGIRDPLGFRPLVLGKLENGWGCGMGALDHCSGYSRFCHRVHRAGYYVAIDRSCHLARLSGDDRQFRVAEASGMMPV